MNKNLFFRFLFSSVLLIAIAGSVHGQVLRGRNLTGLGNENQTRYDSSGRAINNQAGRGGDSLVHRDNNLDSITISFRYFDSSRVRRLDSSISDFTARYPLPAHYVTLGNLGTAAHSLLFSPNLKPGWDPGFHAFD